MKPSRSVWMDVTIGNDLQSLHSRSECDVVVVGAGIAGLSTAYELIKDGHTVAVLDRKEIAGGMTCRTTAHLAPVCDDGLANLLSMRGAEQARLFQKSQEEAVNRIETIQKAEKIACEFRRVDGILFMAVGDCEETLDEEVKAAAEMGVIVKKLRGLRYLNREGVPYLRYPNQATFHPLKYLSGLCKTIVARGGLVFPNSAVTEIKESDAGVAVVTENGEVHAKFAVVATNSPINDRVALHTKQAPYRTYAMAFECPKDAVPDQLYWDTDDPYHYIRLTKGRNGRNLLIVGGEDHKTGAADDGAKRFEALETWMRELVPELGKETHRWSGQVIDTLDFGAHIGRNPGNQRIFVVTGDSGQGITHGVAASLLLKDLIAGRGNEYEALYDPSRKPIGAAKSFITENASFVANLGEYLTPGEVGSVDEIGAGEGALMREGISKIAVYRDDNGDIHKLSAACTHLGCLVHWNAVEKGWDCTCHGSHFDADGRVLNGPATSPLIPIGG